MSENHIEGTAAMNDEYSQAIAVLMANDVDFRAISIKLAQTNPTLFLSLSSATKLEPKSLPNKEQQLWYSNKEFLGFSITRPLLSPEPKPLQWIADTINYLNDDNPISAIQLVRASTTLSIKEAKDVVDNVRLALDWPNRVWKPNKMTTDDQRNACRALMKHVVGIERGDVTGK